MPAGLRIWDASGSLTVSLDTRIAKFLGLIQATSSGSMTVPEFSQGTPFIISMPRSNGVNIFSGGGGGSISGTTLTWQNNASFYYGIY